VPDVGFDNRAGRENDSYSQGKQIIVNKGVGGSKKRTALPGCRLKTCGRYSQPFHWPINRDVLFFAATEYSEQGGSRGEQGY
jgi:hypothetical protein